MDLILEYILFEDNTTTQEYYLLCPVSSFVVVVFVS